MSCAEKKDNDLEYWSIGGSADLDYDPAALFNKNFILTSKLYPSLGLSTKKKS